MTPAVAVTGGTYSSVSVRNANTTCRYVGPDKDTPSNCSGISKNTVSYSGSAWGTNLYTVTSAAGKYITANNTSAPTCAAATSGCYTDGANQTSCKQCSSLTAPSVTGGTYSSVSPFNAATTCRYVAPNKDTPSNCSGISKNTVSYTSSGWGANFYTVTSAAGRYITANDNASPTCALADKGYYVAGTNKTSQTLCAAGSYTSSTGQSACTACQNGTTNAGTNATTQQSCGTTCSNATGVQSNSAGWETASWSANSVTNACTIKSSGCSANYYKNNNACLTCSSGTNSKYTLSSAGTTTVNNCYLTTTAGKYIKQADVGTGTQTACTAGSYCPSATIYYGGTHNASTHPTYGGISGCPTGYGNSAASSTKIGQCYLTLALGKKVASAGAGIADCDAGRYCTKTSSDKIYYNTDGGTAAYTGTQCVAGSYSAAGSSSCTACSAGTTSAAGSTSSSACTACTAISGSAGWATQSWNSSNNTVTNLCTTSGCQANYYKSGNTCPTCSSGTNSKYTKSAAGTTTVNNCYLTTTAGKYITSGNAGTGTQSDCASGYYCPGGVNIYKGGTHSSSHLTYGGNTACSTLGGGLYTHSATGASAATNCYAEVEGGKYISAKTDTAFKTCEAGYKCPAGNVNWDGIGNKAACSGTNEWQDTTGQSVCKSVTDGYYKNGNTALQVCGSGYYCKDGARTICTNMGGGLFSQTDTTTESVATRCFLTTPEGSYIAYSVDTAFTTCQKGYKCPGGSKVYYTAAPGGRTACSAGTYQDETGKTTCKNAGDGYYVGSSAAESRTACPTATGTGWGVHTTSTTATAYSACYETRNATNISDKCASGQLKKTAASASTWNTATASVAFNANPGSIVTGSGDSLSCTQCSGAVYSAGGTAIECTACPAQTSGWTRGTGTGWSARTQCYERQTPAHCESGTVQHNGSSNSNEWANTLSLVTTLTASNGYYASNTATSCSACPTLTDSYAYVSGTGWTAITQCKEQMRPTNCYGGYLTKTAKSDGTWDTAISTLTAKAGYKTSGSGDDAICTECGNAYYSANGNGASCTACTTATGWTTYTTSTTAGTYEACYQTQKPANCGSGTVKRTASSISSGTITYGDASVVSGSPLSANAGYYVNGAACSACGGNNYYCTGGTAARATVTSGYYSTGGTSTTRTGQSQCTGATYCASGVKNNCPSGYDADISAKKTANTQCKISVTGGHYIGTAGQTSSNWGTCGASYYKEPHLVNYNSTSSCSSCPSGYSANTSTGKGAVSQCQITCSAGKYMASGTYTRLQYLQSSGTQYINTGFAPNSDFKHTLVFEVTSSANSSKYICGTGVNEGRSGNVRVNGNTIDGIYVNAGAGAAVNILNGTKTLSGQTTLIMDLHNNATNVVSLNGQSVSNSNTGTIISPQALHLFGMSGSYLPTGLRIYSSVIEQNNAVIKNLVPVRRNSDNVLGMLDLVSGTFFTNAGSGTFTAGPDVEVIGGTCSNVGTGYYAASSTVGYGTNATRSACPDSYTTETETSSAITQCYLTVAGGNVRSGTSGTTLTQCSAGTYKPEHNEFYGTNYSCPVCDANTYSNAGASSCTACATANGYGNSGNSASAHSGIASCKVTCGPGTYVATAGGKCTNVGTTYWGAGGVVAQNATLARNACPSGMVTYGSGYGANEAGDCGRILHAGDYSIYLRSVKKTTPSLNVKIGDTTYYGNMHVLGTGKSGHLHMNYGGNTYLVCDETGNACSGI